MKKRLLLIIATVVGLNFFGQLKWSVADTIYVYGLVNPATGKIDGQTEVRLKNDLEAIVGDEHNIIFDDNRNEQNFKDKEVLLNTGGNQADWIIFFGHGSSSKGYIYDDYYEYYLTNDSAKKYKFYPLKDLMYEQSWSNIKGVLIFGCAVLDIGDFGWQRSISRNNPCDNSYRGDQGNYCPDNPDPGLKWEELARRNNIKYILGFNFFAPMLEEGGDEIAKKFFSNWMGMENKHKGDSNFLDAWKQELVIRNDSGEIIGNKGARIIERAYIERVKWNDYQYSMGRANNFSNEKELYWPVNWQFAWGNDDYFLPNWIEKKSNGDFKSSMPVTNYYKKIKYPECSFDDTTKEEYPTLYYNLRNLCIEGVVSEVSAERKNFYPTVDASLKELSKMVAKAAGIEKYSGSQYPEGLKCKKGKDCSGYIAALFNEKIIEGEREIVLFYSRIKAIDPDEEVDKAKFTKMVMKAFFKNVYDKPYNRHSAHPYPLPEYNLSYLGPRSRSKRA